MANKSNKKSTGIVIALAVAILASVIIITIAIANMIKQNGGLNKNEVPSYTLAGVTNTTQEDKLGDLMNALDETNNAVEQGSADDGFVDVQNNVATTSANKQDTVYNPVKDYESLSKNGDNQLSDHHNNKFIKLVNEKYKVDKELLVAIYSEPDTGSNFVLEFSGKKDSDGNIIKSPDTLVKVYAIDKNKNISVATGKTTGNIGVSYAEGTLCFNMMKTIVMPQYPEYFTGV